MAENAAGPSNWLLMFSTAGHPSPSWRPPHPIRMLTASVHTMSPNLRDS